MDAMTTSNTGIILAGGQSSRMGEEKGLVLINGIRFIEHIIAALKPLVNRILIITNNNAYLKLGFECFSDDFPNKGPLGGIYTGLRHSDTINNFVLSCDVPLITTPLLQNIQEQHFFKKKDITIVSSNTRAMPLVGMYNQSCAVPFKKLILNNKLKLMDALKVTTVNVIKLSAPETIQVTNINSKIDLKNAHL